MRLLMTVFSPLSPEFGAAQSALHLSAALRAEGMEVVLWTPEAPSPGLRWWRRAGWMRATLARFAERNGPFDVIDAPPIAITSPLARAGTVIARSIQPDLSYLWAESVHGGRTRRSSMITRIATVLYNAYLGMLVIRGWHLASVILCLGSAELAWMRRWMPWWRGKLQAYVNATSDGERDSLAALREARRPPSPSGRRLLWLGRWSAQKGADLLLEYAQRHLANASADRLTIAGCGADAERCIPAALLQTGAIAVVPSYGRRELLALLGSHDAGLFTSRTEGWGLSLQEMLESGMPVYATRTGAVPDLEPYFGHQLRGFPPPESQPQDEATAVDWRHYYERFSWSAIARGYAEMARDTLRGAPR